MKEMTHTEARLPQITEKKGIYDKRTTLSNAVKRFLKDNIDIVIGGCDNNRTPVASIHEIIRQGARDLTLSVQSSSICCELLAGAMILAPDHLTIRQIKTGWYGRTNNDHGPLVRYLANSKIITLDNCTRHPMSAKPSGVITNMPSTPTIDHGGPDLRPTRCDDLALLHVHTSDIYGNSEILGDHFACHEIAQTSINTLVTVERIIHNSSARNHPNPTEIPFHAVDAVVDQPFGATPGACYGNYWFDMAEIQYFTDICEEFYKTGSKEELRAYYDRYIFDMKNFDDFLEQKPYPILQELCLQVDGDAGIPD